MLFSDWCLDNLQNSSFSEGYSQTIMGINFIKIKHISIYYLVRILFTHLFTRFVFKYICIILLIECITDSEKENFYSNP